MALSFSYKRYKKNIFSGTLNSPPFLFSYKFYHCECVTRLKIHYCNISINTSAHIFLPSPFRDSASGSGPRGDCVFPLCEGAAVAARGCYVVLKMFTLRGQTWYAWGRRDPAARFVCLERQLNLKTHGFCAFAQRRIHFSRESTKNKLWPDAWESSSLFLLFSRAFAPS